MKIYFNCNNTTQTKVLYSCGVKNILLTYKYSNKNISEYRDFENIMVTHGGTEEVDRYVLWLKDNKEYYDMATQYDFPMNIEKSITEFKEEKELGIDTMPVLTGNYLQHLQKLQPVLDETNIYICIGKMNGKLEEDTYMPKLPTKYKYHGLAKGRWMTKNSLMTSIDSSNWVSATLGRKAQVYKLGEVKFGMKGKADIPLIRKAYGMYKKYCEMVNMSESDIVQGKYMALLKASLAFYYMPILDEFGYLKDNFNF